MALNPHQRQKVDISAMTEEEQKLFKLYGKLPPKKNVAKHNLMERKYFDSGDYALSKAGKTAPQSVGTTIPSPENIHHASHPSVSTTNSAGNGIPLVHNNSAHSSSEAHAPLTATLPHDGADSSLLNSLDSSIVAEAQANPSDQVPPTMPTSQ